MLPYESIEQSQEADKLRIRQSHRKLRELQVSVDLSLMSLPGMKRFSKGHESDAMVNLGEPASGRSGKKSTVPVSPVNIKVPSSSISRLKSLRSTPDLAKDSGSKKQVQLKKQDADAQYGWNEYVN